MTLLLNHSADAVVGGIQTHHPTAPTNPPNIAAGIKPIPAPPRPLPQTKLRFFQIGLIAMVAHWIGMAMPIGVVGGVGI